MSKITKAEKEELLAKAATVLEEVLQEYEALEKMETEEIADPTRMKKEDEESKPADMAAMPEASADEKAEDEDKQEDEEAQDEEQADEKDEDEKDEAEEEPSDEELMRSIAALQAKAEKRGLKKSEPKKEEPKQEEMKKSEAAIAEDLKKSFDDRFETLSKTVATMAETIQKIAAQPVSRKGVAGYAPLKKSEEGSDVLNKSEAIEKLLDLKKNGDRRIGTDLINRLETNRETSQDIKFVKGIVG